MTREQKCKDIVEWTGGCWHEEIEDKRYYKCSCGFELDCKGYLDAKGIFEEHIKESNPTFTNPIDLIKLMMGSEDYCNLLKPGQSFINKIGWITFNRYTSNPICLIEDIYLIEPDKLLTAVHEWLKERRGK